MAKKACAYWQPLCILQPSTVVSLLNVHTQNIAIYSCIMIVCAYSVYIHVLLHHYCMWIQTTATYPCIITVCEYTDYSHLPLYQFCMCILRLLPSTLVALPYVHAQTTGIYSFIITVCASLNYNHPLMYHYCMCILRLQPSNLVSLLYLWRLQAHTLLSLPYVHP
jgi:hypothetical protein